jgi:hypothetical protein
MSRPLLLDMFRAAVDAAHPVRARGGCDTQGRRALAFDLSSPRSWAARHRLQR